MKAHIASEKTKKTRKKKSSAVRKAEREKKARKKKILDLTTMGLFTALIIIMAFTPLGFLKIGAVEISFIMIPVVLGGILLGPWYGAALGGIFGIMSFIQCFGMSTFGVAMMGISPVRAAVVCILTRIVAGFVPALVFSIVKNFDKKKIFSCGLASFLGAALNTVLFVGTFIALFWSTELGASLSEQLGAKNVLAFGAAFAGVNALVEAAVCIVVGTAAGKALLTVQKRMR